MAHVAAFFRKLIFKYRFLLKTGYFPERYHELFRAISNCYLTPQSPGRAEIEGRSVTCTTNGKRLSLAVQGMDLYFIDRDALKVSCIKDEDVPLEHPSLSNLRSILNFMLRKGVPFRISETNVTYLGI